MLFKTAYMLGLFSTSDSSLWGIYPHIWTACIQYRRREMKLRIGEMGMPSWNGIEILNSFCRNYVCNGIICCCCFSYSIFIYSLIMSLFAHDDHSRRLNRAKLQYENLLLHAGEVLVDKDDAHANNSFLSATNVSMYQPHSPVHSKFRG